LLEPKNSTKFKHKKELKKQKHKGNKMNTKPTQTRKHHQNKHPKLIVSILTAVLITGCQTAGAKQNRQMVHVLSEQEALLENVLTERNQAKVKTQVAKSETLTTAELHLAAALHALKQSNQALKEALKNE
jgi:hypothetical protein